MINLLQSFGYKYFSRVASTVLTLVLPPAAQKTARFLACLSQRLRDAVLRIVLTLVRTDDDCVLSFRFPYYINGRLT